MNEFSLEILVLFFVLLAVPAFVYALEKLLQKRIYKRWCVIVLYFVIFYIWFSIMEKVQRGIEDEYHPMVPSGLKNLMQ